MIRPDLSICLASSGPSEPVRDLAAALLEAAGPVAVELIVVENGPGPAEASPLDRDFPEVIVLESGIAEGLDQARARAVQLASGRYIALWDAGARPEPGCLRRLVDAMDDRPEVGAAGPKIVLPGGGVLFSARTFAILPALLHQTGLGRLLVSEAAVDRHLMRLWPHNDTREVDWLLGLCLCIRRETLEEAGPPDPRLEGEFVALDFCRRARRAGWHILYIHDAVVALTPTAAGVERGGGVMACHLPSLLRYARPKWRRHGLAKK